METGVEKTKLLRLTTPGTGKKDGRPAPGMV
jgi:hypothetical protein